jgi:hypothetical protein
MQPQRRTGGTERVKPLRTPGGDDGARFCGLPATAWGRCQDLRASQLKGDPSLESELRSVAELLSSCDDEITIYVWDLATLSHQREDRVQRALEVFVKCGYLGRRSLWECACGATGDSYDGFCPVCGRDRANAVTRKFGYYIESYRKGSALRKEMRALIDKPLLVFYSYADADPDRRYKDELDKHLEMLRRDGVIKTWHNGMIAPGSASETEIRDHLEGADIIVLLVSADFLSSVSCYDKDLAQAMERHERGDAVVIPVIARPCDWESAPFGKLQALPPGARPIAKWRNRDDAWTKVSQGIRAAAKKIKGR